MLQAELLSELLVAGPHPLPTPTAVYIGKNLSPSNFFPSIIFNSFQSPHHLRHHHISGATSALLENLREPNLPENSYAEERSSIASLSLSGN